MTKAKHITAFRNINNASVDLFSCRFANVLICLIHKLILQPSGQNNFRLSAVNYQTVYNDLYLAIVQTNNCFFRRHNTADVRTSQLVAGLLTANCNFGSL